MNDNKSQLNISTIAQLSSAALIVCYALGFIVVNSYLIKIGVHSFNMLNSQYLAAGVGFSMAAGIFGFVVGRRIFFLEHDFTYFASLGEEYRFSKFWASFCFVYVYVELAFGGLVAAFWTASLLFDGIAGIKNMLLLLTLMFLIDYFVMWRGGIYKKYPFVALPISFFGFQTIVLSAIILTPDPIMYSLYGLYFSTGLILNFIIDIGHRRTSNVLFTAFWGCSVIIITAAIFGSTFYGEIKRQYGGGKPFAVQFIVAQDFPAYLARIMNVENGLSAEAHILGETDTEFLIQASAERISIRLSRSLINAVIPVPVKKPEIPATEKLTSGSS